MGCGVNVMRVRCMFREVPTHVKGRLKERLSFWKDELKVSAFILDVIEHGYVLPLKSEPTPYMGKNQASVFANKKFVGERIEELLVAGSVRQVILSHLCTVHCL